MFDQTASWKSLVSLCCWARLRLVHAHASAHHDHLRSECRAELDDGIFHPLPAFTDLHRRGFFPVGSLPTLRAAFAVASNAAGRALTDAPRFLMSCRNGALTSSATGPTRIRLRCTHRWQSRRPGLSPLTRLGVEACIEPSDIDRRTCVPWNRWLQKTRRELSPSDPAPTPYAAGRLAVVCSSLCRA